MSWQGPVYPSGKSTLLQPESCCHLSTKQGHHAWGSSQGAPGSWVPWVHSPSAQLFLTAGDWGGRRAERGKKERFVQTATQCEHTPRRTTKEMSACHPSRDGTPHSMALSQHSSGVVLMS